MKRKPVTFRMDPEQTKAIDAIASGIDRDRSYVLKEAVRAYIDIHKWQIEHIKEGIRQADAGEFATDEEIKAVFSKIKK